MLARFIYQPLNFVLVQVGAGSNGDFLFAAGGFVFCAYVQNAVGINVKSDLHLRHATRRRRNTFQPKLAHGHVVLRHAALALQNVNIHRRLPVRSCGENLALVHRDGGVALNQRGHHTAQRFEAQ